MRTTALSLNALLIIGGTQLHTQKVQAQNIALCHLSLEAISRLNPDLLGTVLIQICLHGTCKLRRNVLSISNSPCASQTEGPWNPSFSAKFSRDDCTYRNVPSGCSGSFLQRYGMLNLCRVPPQTWHLEAPHPLWARRAVSVLGVASAPTSGEWGRAVCGMTAPGSVWTTLFPYQTDFAG